MLFTLLSIFAITFDNVMIDFLLQDEKISIIMLIILWYFFGIIFGTILNITQGRENFRDNLRKLSVYRWKIGLYLASSVIGTFLWIYCVSTVGVGDVVILMEVALLIPILFGVYYYGESFSKKDYGALTIMFLGTGIFLYKGESQLHVGALLVFISGIMYALQGILKKVFSQKINYIFLVNLRSLSMLIVGISVAFIFGIFKLPTDPWIYILCFLGGVGGSFFHKIFWFRALETVPLSRYTVLSKISTVLIYILAILFLGETLTFQKAFGGIIIILTACFISYKPKAIKKI